MQIQNNSTIPHELNWNYWFFGKFNKWRAMIDYQSTSNNNNYRCGSIHTLPGQYHFSIHKFHNVIPFQHPPLSLFLIRNTILWSRPAAFAPELFAVCWKQHSNGFVTHSIRGRAISFSLCLCMRNRICLWSQITIARTARHPRYIHRHTGIRIHTHERSSRLSSIYSAE